MSERTDFDRADRPWTAQPPPRPGTGPTVVERVVEMAAVWGHGALARLAVVRGEFGERKYDTALRAHDGRDSVCDGAEEGTDFVNYLVKAAEEGEPVGHLIGPLMSIAEEVAQLAEARRPTVGDPP